MDKVKYKLSVNLITDAVEKLTSKLIDNRWAPYDNSYFHCARELLLFGEALCYCDEHDVSFSTWDALHGQALFEQFRKCDALLSE